MTTTLDPAVERDRIIAEIIAKHPRTTDRGLAIIERHATTAPPGAVFDANTLRDQLTAVGVRPGQAGAVFGTAIRRRIIRVIGYVPSTKSSTKHHRIAQYQSCRAPVPAAPSRQHLDVPVIRDSGGRFATEPQRYDVPLFDLAPPAASTSNAATDKGTRP